MYEPFTFAYRHRGFDRQQLRLQLTFAGDADARAHPHRRLRRRARPQLPLTARLTRRAHARHHSGERDGFARRDPLFERGENIAHKKMPHPVCFADSPSPERSITVQERGLGGEVTSFRSSV